MEPSTIESSAIILVLINLAVLFVAVMAFYQNCGLKIQIKYLWLAIDALEEENRKRKHQEGL